MYVMKQDNNNYKYVLAGMDPRTFNSRLSAFPNEAIPEQNHSASG